MELQYHPPQLHRPIPTPLFFPYHLVPDNYIHWIETPDSDISSPSSPVITTYTRSTVTKEEIQVEVEDSTYMSIRTEAMVDREREPARKFRFPVMVDVNGITAGYEDGVLTVVVPRALVSRGFFIDPSRLARSN